MVQSSNPKQKYQQQHGVGGKGGRDGPLLVDQQHKQKPPLLVTVPETMDCLLLQRQDGTPTLSQTHVSISHGQSEHTTDLYSVKEKVPSAGHEPMTVEDMKSDELNDISTKGDKQVPETQGSGTNMLATTDEHRTNERENEHEHQLYQSLEEPQLQEGIKQVSPQTAASTHCRLCSTLTPAVCTV